MTRAEKPQVQNLTEIEKELAITSWLEEHEIKKVIFDGDDTLWEMQSIFVDALQRFTDVLGEYVLDIPREDLYKQVRTLNYQYYTKEGVSPLRWKPFVEEYVAKYKLPEKFAKTGKEIFSNIYFIPPVFLQDTEKTLEFLKKANVDMGIVTHANLAWTVFKYNSLSLDRFIPMDDVYAINEFGHKSVEEWDGAFKYFGVNPENTVVIGDSPKSDLRPTHTLGVKQLFHIFNGQVWETQKDDIVELVTQIPNISGFTNLAIKEIIFGNNHSNLV